MPLVARRPRRSSTSRGRRRGGHIKRVAATGGAPETLTRSKATTSIPSYTPDGSRDRVPRRRGVRSALLDPDGHAAGGRASRATSMRRARSAASIRPTRSRSAGCRRPAARRRSSARRRAGAARISRATTRRASTSRPTAACSRSRSSGFDRRTLLRITGSGPGNNPPAADEIRLSPDGTRAFVNLQGKHYLVTVPRAGRETVEVRIQGRADNTAVPVKRMSLEGGDYLDWTARRHGRHLGAGARSSSGRHIDAAEPQKTDVVVEMPRSRPTGSVLLTGARIITMKGDEVIAQRRRPRHRQPHRRRRRARHR